MVYTKCIIRTHRERGPGGEGCFPGQGSQPGNSGTKPQSSLSAGQSQSPHFPSSIIGLKARFPISLAAMTICDCRLHFYIWCLNSLMYIFPVILSLHLDLVCVVLSFIFKCQWSNLWLSSRNDVHSACIPYIAGAESLKTTLPRIPCRHDCSKLDSTNESHPHKNGEVRETPKTLLPSHEWADMWDLADVRFCSR